MSLSCGCDYEWDGEGWMWMDPAQIVMPIGIRKRCCSCKELIDINSDAVEFFRYRSDDGNPFSIASWFMCEKCGDIYWSLEALGYSIELGDDMHDLLCDYHELQENQMPEW